MNSKRLIYITNSYLSYKNKIDGQIKAYINLGISTVLCIYSYKNETIELKIFNDYHNDSVCSDIYKIKKYKIISFIETHINANKYDYIYIRRPGISILLFDRIIRETNRRNEKLIFEIPTFPIDRSESKLKMFVQSIEQTYIKTRIYKNADCIPVFLSSGNVLLNSKMVSCHNSVDCDRYIGYIYNNHFSSTDEFRMLGIAHLQSWHGYERIIRAMMQYNGQRRIRFLIVGDYTEESRRLFEFCENNNICNVQFVEEKCTEDIVKLACNYNIGIGCMENYKELDTSIKNKEYCALGLPFIHSSKDLSFGDDFLFHKVYDRSVELRIDDIILWYDSLKMSNEKRIEMWKYAKENLGFDTYVKDIVEKCE